MHDKNLLEAKKKEEAQEETKDFGIGSTLENTRKNEKNVGNMNGKMGQKTSVGSSQPSRLM